MTLIVAGKVYVDPSDRDRFIEGHRNLVEQARRHPGCIDLSISPDPTEAGRVNIFEHWESQETLDAWRAVVPPPAVSIDIEDDQVRKHEISRSGHPFG
ncbi:Antibiotic biosynthesis monooxygenase [Saccharopolyspora antimicrobica]|uniref:Antibiotic biosynthesis monooxygenase n=1 Tax=Saccharopolyspora antimicrobica TaxID=455193 RepID=A0A1I5BDR5_9PSEU|nr:antibiotic biosynthesis monooxygenase [Saccharopolyspora antimicrobica]RKT86565.1 antibiotic biosynthesis monooxygenase [Saccharopolyspora antimicrobica]SFN72641.1 Antibiotic biosynthesis monooxygenase [Saccharopolyspora antimicrobica]